MVRLNSRSCRFVLGEGLLCCGEPGFEFTGSLDLGLPLLGIGPADLLRRCVRFGPERLGLRSGFPVRRHRPGGVRRSPRPRLPCRSLPVDRRRRLEEGAGRSHPRTLLAAATTPGGQFLTRPDGRSAPFRRLPAQTLVAISSLSSSARSAFCRNSEPKIASGERGAHQEPDGDDHHENDGKDDGNDHGQLLWAQASSSIRAPIGSAATATADRAGR